VKSIGMFNSKTGKYLICLHGGCGHISKTTEKKKAYIEGLRSALEVGLQLLKDGKTSLDATEAVIRILEDNPTFNAGKGSVLANDGTCELEASIMEGKTLQCGAAALLTTVKNPISLARKVMENTKNVFLVGPAAEKFASQLKLDIVDNNYFKTDHRKQQLEDEKNGTVGCVALDIYGNLAAGTSTGGRNNKMNGRLGDTCMIGAATYAHNSAAAISTTGIGEEFIRHHVASNVVAMMKYKNVSLKEASDYIVFEELPKEAGGLIGVDINGNVVCPYNTFAMFRAIGYSNGSVKVGIWENWEIDTTTDKA